MNQQIEPFIREIRACWRGGVFDAAATQKSGDVQYGAVPVETVNGEVLATLGYRRYLDCDAKDAPGQDYAALRGDRNYLVGVLADGVGQSFYGNLAAERVANWLITFLWDYRKNPPAASKMEIRLRDVERAFADEVARVSLAHLPAWHQDALQRTRLAGSQSVFAAFVWDVASQRARLYLVGDIIVLVVSSGNVESMEADPKGRWSSAGKSNLHLVSSELDTVSAILLKTDGADPAWGRDIYRETGSGESFARMSSSRAANDDVSFVAGSLASDTSPLKVLPVRIPVERLPRERAGATVIAPISRESFAPAKPQVGFESTALGQRSPVRPTGVRVSVLRLIGIVVLVCAVLIAFVPFLVRSRHSSQAATSPGPPALRDSYLQAIETPDQPRFVHSILKGMPDAIVLGVSTKEFSGLSLEGSDLYTISRSQIFTHEDELYVLVPQAQALKPKIRVSLFRSDPKKRVSGAVRIENWTASYYKLRMSDR